MRILGFEIARVRAEKAASGVSIRPNDGQGPFTAGFRSWVLRKIEADFYEFMREAVPFLDAGINKLCSLGGRVRIVGDNAKLVDELKEWYYNVPVNHVERGFQAFDKNFSGEAFEQGFAIAEFITDRKRTDIAGLVVADSKTIRFRRRKDGSVEAGQRADGDQEERPLKWDNLMYFANEPENMNPYGTSKFRSLEFTSKVFATMHNALLNNWERWGDPSLHAHLKSAGKLNPDKLESMRKKVSDDLNTAFRAKREGKSADLVTAAALDSELVVKVIGSDGKELQIEAPMRHVVENFVAKLGLPPWALGLHWSTTERLSDAEAEMILADVRTRQAAKGPLYYNLFRTLLLLRGRTWKPGDWGIEWEQVNLHDIFKQAQANFLNAQAEMMRGDASEPDDGKAYRVRPGSQGGSRRGDKVPLAHECGCKECSGGKELHRTVDWPELDEVEDGYEADLKGNWAELEEKVLDILKLSAPKGAKLPVPPDPTAAEFAFSEEQRAAVMDAMRKFVGIYEIRDEASPVRWYYGRAYSLGVLQAAQMLGKERPILDIVHNRQVLEEIYRDGFKLVKDNATKAIVEKILPELDAQVLAASNPRHVADRLRKLFGQGNSNWERLARTEMSMAAEGAKLDEWKEWGVDTKGAVVAGKDTHPRCRCANTIEEVDGKPVVKFAPAPDACEICLALAD